MDSLRKKVVFLSIYGFLLAGIILFFVRPLVFNILEMTREINQKEKILKQKHTLGKDIAKNLNKLREIKNSSYTCSAFVVSGEELEFIESLEKIADKCSLKQNIDIGEIIDKKKTKKLPVTVTLEGNFTNLLKYLVFLEKEKYYVNIYSLALSSSFYSETEKQSEKQFQEEKDPILKLSFKAFAYLK